MRMPVTDEERPARCKIFLKKIKMVRYYNIICAKNADKDTTVYLPFNGNSVGILRYDYGIDITHEEFMLGLQLMFQYGSQIECEGGWVIYNPNDDQR